jgi:hypothetical protein
MPSEVITEPIAFLPSLETSSEEIGGGSPEAYNIIVDRRGVIRKRPGLVAYTGVAPATSIDAAGVLGLYLTEQRVAHTSGTPTVSGTHPGVLYAVGATVNASGGGHNAGRNVYRVASGAATLVGTGAANEDRLATPATIASTRFPRPIFAETEALLVIAGGAEIGKVDIRPETFSAPNFTTNADYHEMSFLGGCPPLASHVLTNSSRILANDTQLDQTKLRYSDITQGIVDFTPHESWDPSPGAAGFFTAEARADSIVACAENTNDIFLFGRTSLQLFSPDPSTTFAPSVTREVGCLAAYSPVKLDDKYAWLDHLTRIIVSDGREWDDVGAPVQATLDDLTTPSDCYAYRFSESFADCVVFRFEADQETLVLQPGIGWSRWALHDAEADAFTMFPVLCHHLRQDGGLNVVGLEDGTIRVLSLEAETDLGEPIVAHVSSGFEDRKTDNLKQTVAVYVTIKRTQAVSEGVTCYLEYRDDLSAEWTTIDIELGVDDGNHTPTIPIRSLGVYRRRQWRFRFPDSAPLALVRALEAFRTLDD